VFELLVILAILAILLGLLFPALARVRTASSRVQSQNNLKQIGLACHSYHDTMNMLPPGNDANNFSVASRLLPWLEQDNVYKQIDFQKPSTDAANEQARKTQVRIFLSPQDPVQKVSDSGATNYLFNAGSQVGLADNNGVFYQDSQVTFPSIADGTSNTLFTAETLKGDPTSKPPTVQRYHVALKADDLKELKEESGVDDFKNGKRLAADRCASWIDGRFLQGTFTATRLLNDPRPDVNCAGTGGLSGLRSLSSGTNVGMCDGSVRFINAGIKLDVLKALATRNGGEVVGDF